MRSLGSLGDAIDHPLVKARCLTKKNLAQKTQRNGGRERRIIAKARKREKRETRAFLGPDLRSSFAPLRLCARFFFVNRSRFHCLIIHARPARLRWRRGLLIRGLERLPVVFD
jgi:hypothetical protein